MGRVSDKQSPRIRRQYLSFRIRSSFAARVVLVVLLLAVFQQQRLYLISRGSLAAKYSPTSFEKFNATAHLIPDEALRLQERLLSNRDKWEVLGQGFEGKTFKYDVFVIKTFTPGRSPFRNCAPGDSNDRWPTEIPASLMFGTLGEGEHFPKRHNNTDSSFLSVQAYFMAISHSSIPEWHLVTPLLPGGDILKLAKRLKEQHPSKTFREVDAAFRPTFNHLLGALDTVHIAGYCHDDIKPANIFVNDDTHWVLGDLGNVRHISHPYHSSRLWVKDNHQLPDCRANDVLRALKTYLQFLRAASNDADAFDTAFFDGREPLSRLFWWIFADAPTLTAAELRVRSEVENPEQPPLEYASLNIAPQAHSGLFAGLFFSKRKILSRVVDLALETSFSERAARLAGLTGVMGIPVQAC